MTERDCARLSKPGARRSVGMLCPGLEKRRGCPRGPPVKLGSIYQMWRLLSGRLPTCCFNPTFFRSRWAVRFRSRGPFADIKSARAMQGLPNGLGMRAAHLTTFSRAIHGRTHEAPIRWKVCIKLSVQPKRQHLVPSPASGEAVLGSSARRVSRTPALAGTRIELMGDIAGINGLFRRLPLDYAAAPGRARTNRNGTALATPRTAGMEMVDEVELSDFGRLLSRMTDSPGVRLRRMAKIRAAIDAGTYETPAKTTVVVDRLFLQLQR